MVKTLAKRMRRRVRRYYARAKRRASGMKLPVAVLAGFGVGLVQPAQYAIAGDISSSISQLTKNYTGIDWRDGSFHAEWLKAGAMPLLAGIMIHKVAGILGVNRALGAAKVPFLRV